MASSTTTAEHQLLSGALLSGAVSSSSVDDEDEMYDDEMHPSSSINAIVESASANKRRKQTKPIRFSAVASEENDRAVGADVLDLSKTPVVGANNSTTASSAARANGAKPQRSGATPAQSGAAVLDLCVKAPTVAAGNSLKPHNDNNNVDNASRKRRLSGNNNASNRKPGETASAPVPTPCSLCHVTFQSRVLLQKHMKEAHGVAIPDSSSQQQQQQPGNKQQRGGSKSRPASNKPAVNNNNSSNNNNSLNNKTNDSTVHTTTTANMTTTNTKSSTSEAANAAAAAALAQALFLPGVTGSAASTQSTITTSNPAFNSALMFLHNPWASVLPPDSLAKLIQAYQMGGVNGGGNHLLQNAAATSSSSGASPQASSSPGLATNNGDANQHGGRSNPTPPSSSDRSSPMPNNTNDDAPANFATKRRYENTTKMETVEANWDGLEGSTASAGMSSLGGLPLLGFDDPSMLDQKPADSLLRSTVAARMADRVECDICHKQVCNKYFLKSHKLKIHGIIPPAESATPNNKSKSTPAAITASPSPSLYQGGTNNDVAASLISTDLPTSGLTEALLNSLPGLFRSPAAKSENNVSTDKTLTNGGVGDDNNNNKSASKSSSNLFAGSALLRTQSPQPTSNALNLTPATPSSSTACIDLSVRRQTTQSSGSSNSAAPAAMIRPFGSPSSTGFASQQQAFPAYLPPMPGMPPGAIPPPGWRPGSTWRWKETSSISRVTCDICGKELCNKYFLRTHKQNRHGIKDETKSSTSGSSKSNKNPANNGGSGADGGQIEWMSSLPIFPTKDGPGDSEAAKYETARCRCSECGKRFLSSVVYRRHMGLCHGIPVLIGAEHDQRNRNSAFLNKLKRQSRRRRHLQEKLMMSSADTSSPHLAEFGVNNPDEDAVTFQIVSTVCTSPNDSGMTVEMGSELGDTFFDWPQQLCVYLKKRQQQTPSTASSCESGVGVENASSTSKSFPTTLPTTVTLTLKLQERKPGSYVAMRPVYTKTGELLAIPTSGFEMMTANGSSQQSSGNNLLMPSSSAMLMYSSGEEEGEVPVEQDNNSAVGSGEAADSEMMAAAMATMATTSEQGSHFDEEEGDEEGGMMIAEAEVENEEVEPMTEVDDQPIEETNADEERTAPPVKNEAIGEDCNAAVDEQPQQ